MKIKPLFFGCLLLLAACNSLDPEAERMEMALQQGQAIYGDDRDATDPTQQNGNFLLDSVMNFTYIVPDIDRAPDYFAQKGQPKKAALAALYKGYDLQEIAADSLALPCFEEATRYGLLANDSLTVARAQFQTGRLLYQKDQYKEAAAALESADRYFGQRLYERAFVQNILGLNYYFLNEPDKAETCFNQCVTLTEESGNDDALWRAAFNYSVMLGNDTVNLNGDGILALRQLETGKDGLKLAVKAFAMQIMLMNYNLRNGIEPICDDSCNYYSEIWADAMQSISDIKMFLAYGCQHDLFPVFTPHWDTDDNLGGGFYTLKKDNRQRQRDEYLALRNATDGEKIQKQHKTLVYCIVALVAVVLIIGAVLFWMKRKPKTEEKAKVAPTKTEMPETDPFVGQDISARLRLILTAVRAKKRANDFKKEWNPLVRQVMNGKETPFEAAASVIEGTYPGLQAKISELYPDLNETDSKVCLLSCSDLTNSEMGELLGLTVYSVNKSRSKLRKMLGFDPGELKNRL